MKLYTYRSLENEKVPKDVTHAIVDDSVTAIKRTAFYRCRYLVSVIMGDNVKGIEVGAFCDCRSLRFIRLSKVLEYIGVSAFGHCESLEALFLPSTVKSIEEAAFIFCASLRLLILPNHIDPSNIGKSIIYNTAIHQIARISGVAYEYVWRDDIRLYTIESNRRVNEWLFHHMDEAPFHELCYKSSIKTKHINNYLNEHGYESALAIDTIYRMTPLHMLSMNPHAPPDAIGALLNVNVDAAFRLDNQGKIANDYARNYNVGGMIAMINGLCNHRHAAARE